MFYSRGLQTLGQSLYWAAAYLEPGRTSGGPMYMYTAQLAEAVGYRTCTYVHRSSCTHVCMLAHHSCSPVPLSPPSPARLPSHKVWGLLVYSSKTNNFTKLQIKQLLSSWISFPSCPHLGYAHFSSLEELISSPSARLSTAIAKKTLSKISEVRGLEKTIWYKRNYFTLKTLEQFFNPTKDLKISHLNFTWLIG